ncbi:MAG: ferric reductase-like transmembrane domain-containing protein [Trueperaceae bacterium]
MEPATRSSNQTLGGTRADWRYRITRFHVPLAIASAVVLVLSMTLPPFDAGAYPSGDIRSGPLPQPSGPMDHGGDQTVAMDGDSHGGGQSGARNEADQGEGRTGPLGMGEDEAARMGDSEMREMMHAPFLGVGMRQWTVATGYVALGLLGLTLLIGPANLLLRRRNPVSSYLRRDVGTWTAVASVVHVIFGFQVHGNLTINSVLSYFFIRDGSPRLESFGLGNWTGLAATAIVVGLLAFSSDFALRKLKAPTWKNLQRLNYALFVLVIAHAFFYGALLRLESPYTLLLLLSVVAVFVGQAAGVWLWRRRYSRYAGRKIP